MIGNCDVVVVATSVVTDPMGDSTETTSEFGVSGCAFDPGGSREFPGAGPAVVTLPTLYMPPDVEIGSDDRVRVDGRMYAVEGEPRVWRPAFSPTGPGGVVVELKRWEQT